MSEQGFPSFKSSARVSGSSLAEPTNLKATDF